MQDSRTGESTTAPLANGRRKPYLWALLAILAGGIAISAVRQPIDFRIYHGVGNQVLRGNWDLYPEVARLGERAQDVGFRYAPALALAFAPFALLPLPWAALLFFCLKIAALVSLLAMTSRTLELHRSRLPLLILVSVLSAGGPLVEEFRNGNAHMFITYCLVASMPLAGRGRIVGPAALVASAIATKLSPGLVLLYWLVRQRVRLVLATAALAGLVFVAPAAFIGISANATLLTTFARAAAQTARQPGNFSLRGTLLSHLTADANASDRRYPEVNFVALPQQTVNLLWLLISALLVAALIAFWRRNHTNRGDSLVDYALIVAAIPLLSPHSQRIHYSALVFPFAVLVGIAMRRFGSRRLTLFTVGAGIAVMTIAPLALPGRELALRYAAHSPYAPLTVLLIGTLIAVGIRRRPSGSEEHPAAGELTR